MTFKLRPYQQDAVTAVCDYFKTHNGNPIVAMPTGTGKSLVIGALIKLAMPFKHQRVLVLTHVKELLEQNCKIARAMIPNVDAGMYSAGLNKRDTNNRVIFGGIASIHTRPDELGKFDLMLIDECHLISNNTNSMYQQFITAQKALNKKIRIVGFSATPYRFKGGLLVDGTVFDAICYDLTSLKAFNKLVDDKFLAPLIAHETSTTLSITNVGTRGGELIPGQLQRAVDTDPITRKVVRELVNKGQNRHHWLIFATGINHCDNVVKALIAAGITATAVHGRMDTPERSKNIAAFKSGEIRALVNNNILTTGFDCPDIDLIGLLRPTLSPGLWVQMLGRGTRIHPNKENCLVLDFAGNSHRLGPINDVILPAWRKGKKTKGTAPVKTCENCQTINHASVRECVLCGTTFPTVNKLIPVASTKAVMAGTKPLCKTVAVQKVFYVKHSKTAYTPSTMKVSYVCGVKIYNEWICVEHKGYALRKAREWWLKRATSQLPKTVDEALKLSASLAIPQKITVALNNKYPVILNTFF